MKHDEASVMVRRAVAGNIRALRIECGHSQAKFAEMINVNRSYINQIELGKENVSLDILVKIADGLDKPITDFFQGLEGFPPRELTHRAPTRPEARRGTGHAGTTARKSIHYYFSEFPPAGPDD